MIYELGGYFDWWKTFEFVLNEVGLPYQMSEGFQYFKYKNKVVLP